MTGDFSSQFFDTHRGAGAGHGRAQFEHMRHLLGQFLVSLVRPVEERNPVGLVDRLSQGRYVIVNGAADLGRLVQQGLVAGARIGQSDKTVGVHFLEQLVGERHQLRFISILGE